MIAFVTLSQAKAHLRIAESNTAHDTDVTMKIEMASEIVLDYLKKPSIPTEWLIGSPQTTIAAPALIQAATLLVLGELFMNREASVTDVLSPAVQSLLERHRDPAMA